MPELVKLEYVTTHNWACALRGMRNPLESWAKSDTKFKVVEMYDDFYEHPMIEEPVIGPNDMDLALRLIRAGSDHRKFLRQIFISFDLSWAWGLWKEYATYKVGTVENSTSQMHKLGSRLLTSEDFAIEEWTPGDTQMLNAINARIARWKDTKEDPRCTDEDVILAWRDMLKWIPATFIYRRTCTLNYEVLRNMYHSRKNHKQKEWRIFLQKLLEEIPYPEFITENN